MIPAIRRTEPTKPTLATENARRPQSGRRSPARAEAAGATTLGSQIIKKTTTERERGCTVRILLLLFVLPLTFSCVGVPSWLAGGNARNGRGRANARTRPLTDRSGASTEASGARAAIRQKGIIKNSKIKIIVVF